MTSEQQSKKRILLVDDDESLRQMYTLILTKAGYDMTTADDGIKGLAKIREGNWDLILLDLMMPNMTGIETLHGLKDERGKFDDCPIVILSNAGYSDISKEAMALGASGFIMKADFLPADLVAEVKTYLKEE